MSYTSLLRFCLFFNIFCVNHDLALPFDYLKLVLQWQPSVCSMPRVTCQSPPSLKFTIHGLWPSIYVLDHNLQSSHCTGEKFDQNQLPPALQQDMNAYWPDVKNNKNMKFWGHEWDKHGTCSAMTQQSYFTFTVDTIKDENYNLLSFLKEEGIIPNNKKFDNNTVMAALVKHIGKRPGLRCARKAVQGNPSQLNEVALCFDKTASLMDCIDDYDTNCKGPIIFFG